MKPRLSTGGLAGNQAWLNLGKQHEKNRRLRAGCLFLHQGDLCLRPASVDSLEGYRGSSHFDLNISKWDLGGLPMGMPYLRARRSLVVWEWGQLIEQVCWPC